MERIGTVFRRGVKSSAGQQDIAVVKFDKHDRKQDVMRPYLQRQAATGSTGVAAIGVAQERSRPAAR